MHIVCNSGIAIRNDFDKLSCTIEDRSTQIHDEFEELKRRISYDEDRIQELFDLLENDDNFDCRQVFLRK